MWPSWNFFVGQAGLILKNSDGATAAIDLYLSDCCERYFGFKRLLPKVLNPSDVVFDAVITTHAHYDHFDPDAMPYLMANSKTELFTAEDGLELCQQLNIPSLRTTVIKKETCMNIRAST